MKPIPALTALLGLPLLILPVITMLLMGFSEYPTLQISLIEICDNGLDDDNDGLIDLNDPDCTCELITPVSLIPNPSFEEMNCCPGNRSELACATGWIRASEPTTDFLHTCGWMGWDEFPPAQPFPDGEGIMGFRDGRVLNGGTPEPNWKEYAGACLLNPMKALTTYRFEFYVGFVDSDKSPPIDITFFGSRDCANLPFGTGDQFFGCPTNGPGWVKLGATRVEGDIFKPWVLTSLEVTPDEDINAIVIGAPCAATQSQASTYYFFDNLVLADIQSFNFNITPVGNACSEDYYLLVPEVLDFTYQWFKNGIALPGETSFELSSLYGNGLYQVRIDDGNDCRVSVAFDHRRPVIYTTDNISICEEDTYQFGTQTLSQPGTFVDTFASVQGCDSIVSLNLELLGQQVDTVRAFLFSGETYRLGSFSFEVAGEYPVSLTSVLGCDSLVLLQLEAIAVYIPNVFSPNADGINDVFQVFSGASLIEQVELQVFDRWGALVFTGEEWDGRYKEGEVQVGVYVYVARINFSDGSVRELSGSVTLVK